MVEWIVGGIIAGVVATAVGIYLGRRARVRRREVLQRFARKNNYEFDTETETIHGEVAGVAFQIRAFSEESENGEVLRYTEVMFDAQVSLDDLDPSRTQLELDDRTGWRTPGRARRTRTLQREVDAIARHLGESN